MQGPEIQIITLGAAGVPGTGWVYTWRAPFSGKILYAGHAVTTAITGSGNLTVISIDGSPVTPSLTLEPGDAAGDVNVIRPAAGVAEWTFNEGSILSSINGGIATGGEVHHFLALVFNTLDENRANVNVT